MTSVDLHRLHFAFTVIYHYLFPQLTMGLALLIFVWKTKAFRGDRAANDAARFWIRIFGVAFLMGVITGIPMEFQFGTNWARFSSFSGGVIGQTLAMEGVFAFFLESSFLYLLIFGERKLGTRGHWLASLALFLGTWMSGYFIVCTNGWMQHPVGYGLRPDGSVELASLWDLLTNPWVIPQYLHTMAGTTITAAIVVAATGSFYALRNEHLASARSFLAVGVTAGLAGSVLAAFPTGDMSAKMVYQHQPAAFAAMEGHFRTEEGAPLVILGQPDMERLRLDNPISIPRMLSFLTHARWGARIDGLTEFPRESWPTNVPLLYYSYHVMAGLGTIFILVLALAAVGLARGALLRQRWLLWILMCLAPFPFIANTAGWMTSEFGRQPFVVYGLLRTVDGSSAQVSGGNAVFTLLGFAGMYAFLSLVYVFLVLRIVAKGPESEPHTGVSTNRLMKDEPACASGASPARLRADERPGRGGGAPRH